MAKVYVAIDHLRGCRDPASREDRARLAGAARRFGCCDVSVVGRGRCECRSIHLDVPGRVYSEKAVPLNRPRGSNAVRGRHHGAELDRHERHRFSGGRVIDSTDLAVWRAISI